MKLCLHRRGAQPRRKKVKKKPAPRFISAKEKLARERVERARERIGPAYIMAGARGVRAAMTALLDAELALSRFTGTPVRGARP